MKYAARAIALLLFIATAVVVLIIPHRADDIEAPHDSLRGALNAAKWRYALQSELLRRADSRDLAKTAIAQSRPGDAFTVVRPPSIPRALEDQMRRGEATARKDVRRNDTSMRIVMVLTVDTTSATLRGVAVTPHSGSWSVDVFPPGSLADNVCAVVARIGSPDVLRYPGRADFSARYGTTPSGVCWWYVAYGAPGRGIRSWLDSTGHGPVMGRHERLPWRELVGYRIGEELGRWGFPRGTTAALMTLAPACTAGRLESCSSIMQRPVRSPTLYDQGAIATPGWIGARSWTFRSENSTASALLRQLETEIGAEAFATFWKSDAPLPEAFKAARAEPMDRWVRRQLVATMGTYDEGPLAEPWPLIALLLAIPACLGVGIGAVRRRNGFG